MTLGLSMKRMMRKRAPHLGHVNGSVRYTLRIKRPQARRQKLRKSSFWGASGEEGLEGIGATTPWRRRCPRPYCCRTMFCQIDPLKRACRMLEFFGEGRLRTSHPRVFLPPQTAGPAGMVLVFY